jgi:acyl carrier protein
MTVAAIKRVRKAIGDAVGPDRLKGIEDKHALVQSGIISSLEIVMIGLELEKEFGLVIPNNALTVANFTSLTTLAAMIDALAGEGVRTSIARDEEPRDLYGRLHRSLANSLRRPLLFGALFVLFIVLLDAVAVPLLIEYGPLRKAYASLSDDGERFYRSSGGWAPDDLQIAVARHRIMNETGQGWPRVLFLGDSGTIGSWVRADEAAPALVETRLRRIWPSARVYNFGFFMRSFIKDAMLLEALLQMKHGDLPLDAVILTLSDAYFHKPFQDSLVAAMPYFSLNRNLLRDLPQHIGTQTPDAYARMTSELAVAGAKHRNRFTEAVLERSSAYRYKTFLLYLMLSARTGDAFWSREYAVGEKPLLPTRLAEPPANFQLHDGGFDTATLDRDVVTLADDVVNFLNRRRIKVYFFLRPYAPLEFKGHHFFSLPMTIDNLIRDRSWDRKATIIDLRWSIYGDQFSDSLSHYTPAGNRVLADAIAATIAQTLPAPGGAKP